jgi:hypothetical protein
MAPDLPERYNDGIVPPPDLSADVLPLRQPTTRLTPEQVMRARGQLVVAIIALVALVLACLLLAGYAIHVGSTLL